MMHKSRNPRGVAIVLPETDGPRSTRLSQRWMFLLSILAVMGILSVSALSQSSNTTADLVLGQADFTHNGFNRVDGRGLYAPASVALDTSIVPNRIYVADYSNNRVLGWSSNDNFANGQAADLVIGQPGFLTATCNNGGISDHSLCRPTGVATDSAGNLYVADNGNNRVLEYNAPYSNIAVAGVGYNSANQLFGQSTFSSQNCTASVSAATLCGPAAVAVDAGNNLYIADSRNNRVLEYDTPLAGTGVAGSGDTVADMVFGQFSFMSSNCNFGSNSLNASSLCEPAGVATDTGGNLYVGDTQNDRVLEYNTPASSGNTNADLVFGEGGFGSDNGCSGAASNKLCKPQGVTIDESGNLYVADTGYNRVLEYNTPLNGNTNANTVIGQNNNFGRGFCNSGNLPGANNLCGPQDVATDHAHNLYVADTGNSRVLEYDTPLATGGNTVADAVLGKLDFVHGGPNIASAQSLNIPLGMTIDTTVTPNHVYVADSANNRVLGWKSVNALVNGSPADLVIGQPDFVSTEPAQYTGVSASTLNYPEAVTVDGAGNLYVGDTYDNRVLEYNTPYLKTSVPGSGDTTADMVFGQPNFTSGNPNPPGSPTANSMYQPVGMAVDSAGNLYVGEAGNNRVLEFNNPIGTHNTTPNKVFGQPNFTTANNYICNTQPGPHGTPSASTFCVPEYVAMDSVGNLYIEDHWYNRVLEYNNPGQTGSTTANMVFGQPNFTTDYSGQGPGRLCNPKHAVADAAGNLYISDQCNNRILEYNTPVSSGNTVADLIFGQLGNFNTGQCDLGTGSATANDLCRPSEMSMDSAGNLYVADTWNNRVLEYAHPLGSQ
jgi:sugar lactone lactonase YvrE